MPTTYANKIDNNPIYAARAIADRDGLNIDLYYAKKSELAGKQDTISDLATIRSGAAAGATAVQPGDLATVATTGDYDDLTDKPDLSVYATGSELTAGLATKQDTISDLATIRSGAAAGATAVQPGDLATVATTGAYSDLSGTPSIPTKTSDLTNDNGFITLADVPAQVQSDWTESDSTDPSYIANKPNLAAVATSGDYADLSGTPTINNVPTVTSSDDGKVLKASYTGGVGSYSWDSLPANSAVFTVGVDSYEDIVSAYNDGKICFAQSSGSDYLYPLTRAHVDGTYSTFNFWLDFTPATTYDTNQGIAERTRYTVTSSGWTTTKEKVAPYILAASRIATAINTDTKVLSVSADIPVITSGNDKVIDIADTGRIEVASSAFGGTATKTDTFTRDGYSFYTSDGSRLIGNKWTPFTSYMSGSYTVSFSGGDSSKNLTFTSAGAYTWDDNTLADPSAFPDSATIHYGLFQGELDANNRMTLNPTLIGNLISDVANVTSADSSVSATVTRPENVSMTINVVAGKKLLTAFYVQFSGVTYFLSTSQNPFNKPSILISQQIGNIAKVVEEAPVDTKSYVRKDGAWVEESGGGGGGSYTAGTGIDITNNVVSVDTSVVATQTDLADKEDAFDVGTGLEMDTSGATPTLQVEAPVDIVAGPGIVIDNPDGNTLRVSTDENYEVVLFTKTNDETRWASETLSESITNFERIKVTWSRGGTSMTSDLVTVEYYTSDINNVSQVHGIDAYITSDGRVIKYFTRFTINGSSYSEAAGAFCTYGGSMGSWTTSTVWCHPIRIVGIHRIANN